MTSRERLETAWAFREADRVPIELELPSTVLAHPQAGRLRDLAAQHVDNFVCVNSGAAWGFFGLPTEYAEEEIENVPGSHRRVRHTHTTPAGTFTALTLHPAGGNDYHWEKRFLSTADDLRRLTAAPRQPVAWFHDSWAEAEAKVGSSGLPMVLWIDRTEGEYGLREADGFGVDAGQVRIGTGRDMNEQEDQKPMEYRLAKDLSFDIDNHERITNGLAAISFSPDGSIDETSLKLVFIRDRDDSVIPIAQSRNRLQYEITDRTNLRDQAAR